MKHIKTWGERAAEKFHADQILYEEAKQQTVIDCMRAEIAELRSALTTTAEHPQPVAKVLTDERIIEIAEKVIKPIAGERISKAQAKLFARAILAAATSKVEQHEAQEPVAYMFDVQVKRLGQRRQFAAIDYNLDADETLISKTPLGFMPTLAATQAGDAKDAELAFLEEWLTLAATPVGAECCGEGVAGAEYMGQREVVCCGSPVAVERGAEEVISAMAERHRELTAAMSPTTTRSE